MLDGANMEPRGRGRLSNKVKRILAKSATVICLKSEEGVFYLFFCPRAKKLETKPVLESPYLLSFLKNTADICLKVRL